MGLTGIYAQAYEAYRAAGWPSIIPVDGKELIVKGVTGRNGRMPEPIDYKKWLLRWADKNAALRFPRSIIGIDVDAYDDKPGATTLAELEERWGPLPPTFRSSARVGDRVSGIRFYRVPGEAEVVTEFPGIEIVQFHHRYAVVWPSIHDKLETQYKWWALDGTPLGRVPQPTEFAELPEAWWDGLRAAAPASGQGSPSSGESQSGAGGTRSTLAALLESPPAGDSGRNNWLTRVAGHLAKIVPWQDGFEALMLSIDSGLAVPYEGTDPGGIKKLATSVWETEQRSGIAEDGEMPSQETGWLASSGAGTLVALTEIGGKGEAPKVEKLVVVSDFDMRVLGKYADATLGTHYRLQIDSARYGEPRYVVEPASLFGEPRRLNPRLASLELNVWPVGGDKGKLEGKPAARLGHYLSSQEAPRLQVAPHLGWHDDAQGFVCDEGVITAEGLDPTGGWMPNPDIRKRAPAVHRYGFDGDAAEALSILREVLTFQDEGVAAVFGAWWAAVLVKAQLRAKASLFPFMAIEATSGTGKTTGFFSLMVELNGAPNLGSLSTAASFRDALASNRSGIVWIDDMDDPTRMYQDIRTATAEQTRSKKGADHFTTVSVDLVAPVLLTGETLPGLSDQTALLDRLIRLDVPPVQGRKSLHGDYPQWDDIVRLKTRHPQLWRFSGHYVQAALRHWPAVEGTWAELRTSSGRHADKLAVLRIGARLLDTMTDTGWHAELVDDWVFNQVKPDGDFLTNRILPELLRDSKMIEWAIGWQPVFVKDGTVWFHPGRVADAWQQKYRNADARTRGFGDAATITRHRQANGATQRALQDTEASDRRGRKPYYALPADLSAQVILKAIGE